MSIVNSSGIYVVHIGWGNEKKAGKEVIASLIEQKENFLKQFYLTDLKKVYFCRGF